MSVEISQTWLLFGFSTGSEVQAEHEIFHLSPLNTIKYNLIRLLDLEHACSKRRKKKKKTLNTLKC